MVNHILHAQPIVLITISFNFTFAQVIVTEIQRTETLVVCCLYKYILAIMDDACTIYLYIAVHEPIIAQ